MTVRVDIKYECGCGFVTKDIDRAVAHCSDTGHSMPVYGTIALEKAPGITKPRTSRIAVSGGAAAKVFKSPGEYEDLRKKLKGG